MLHVYRHTHIHTYVYAFVHFGSSNRVSIPNDRNSVRANVNDETVTSCLFHIVVVKLFFFLSKRYSRAVQFAYIVSSLDLLVSRKQFTYSCCRHIGRCRRLCAVIYSLLLLLFVCAVVLLQTNERKDMRIYFPFERLKYTYTYRMKSESKNNIQSSLKSIDRSWCHLSALFNLCGQFYFLFLFSN